MGIYTWLSSLLGPSVPPKAHHTPKAQPTHRISTDEPATPKTRYSSKMQQTTWDPVVSPSPTATTSSSRSRRRRPRRSVAQAAQATQPSPHRHSAPSRSVTPSVYPRPTTPKPAQKAHSDEGDEPREVSISPERSGRHRKPLRPKSDAILNVEKERRGTSTTPDRSRSHRKSKSEGLLTVEEPRRSSSTQRSGSRRKSKSPRPKSEGLLTVEEPRRSSSTKRSGSHRKSPRPKSDGTLMTLSKDDRRMDRDTIRQVIIRVAELFNHIPFVVSGLSAMIYYGFDDRRSANVTIICPGTSREAIRGWATAQDLKRYPDRPDLFGIQTNDGIYRMVRVKYVEEEFKSLHALRSENMRTSVLSLAGLANQLADGYVQELKFANGIRQEGFAADMMWVLKRIAKVKREDHWLTPQRCPHIWSDTFWMPFTLSFPDSVALLEAAGFSVGEGSMTGMTAQMPLSDDSIEKQRSASLQALEGNAIIQPNIQALIEEDITRF